MTPRTRWPLVTLTLLFLAPAPSSRAQQPVATWRVSPQPILTLGSEDDEPAALLNEIVSATRLPDGSILVGDRGDHAFKLFSSSGRFMRAFARKGGGPGEIRYLIRPHRCGDSLYASDVMEGHRVSVFTLDGRYHRAFRYSGPLGQSSPYTSACNGAGRFVHVGWESNAVMRPGAFRALAPVWLGRADDGAFQSLDSVPGSERWGMAREGRMTGTRPLPLGKQPVVGIGRSRVYVGSASEFLFRVYDLDGRPAGELRRPGAPAEVNRADIRAEIEWNIANEGEQFRERLERAYAAIEFPATLPAYTALVVDADDHPWVRGFPRGVADSVTWSVFSPTGTLVAEVSVPRHLEVHEIGRDYMLGRYLDPVEALPQVRMYRLVRRAG